MDTIKVTPPPTPQQQQQQNSIKSEHARKLEIVE